MDIMETTLSDEINKIISRGNNVRPELTAVVHTPVGDVQIPAVLNYDVKRDYLSQFCDEITAVILVPRGQLSFRMALNQDALEITISRTTAALIGTPNRTPTVLVNRYKMILSSPADPVAVAQGRQGLDEFTMDLQGFEKVSVQIFEPVMQQFAMQTVGGIYRKTPVADIVRTILLQASTKPDVDDDYKTVGVDMVEPADAVVRDHVIIPTGTLASDSIGYIHKHCGGIYPAGLSYYYQNDIWYVFPPFDFTRYNDASRQVVIYRIPEARMPQVESTSLVEGSVVSIIATGGFSVKNNTQNKKLTDGNGVIFSDAASLFEKGVVVSGNKALAARAENSNEFVSSKQSDGLNKLTSSTERITANKLFQTSKLSSREGSEIQLVWQNANPDILTPGMQARIYFVREGIVREVQGVLIGMQISIQALDAGILSGVQQCNVGLRFWADPDEV